MCAVRQRDGGTSHIAPPIGILLWLHGAVENGHWKMTYCKKGNAQQKMTVIIFKTLWRNNQTTFYHDRCIVKVLDLSATMFYNAPLSNLPPIVPFSTPNAPVSPSNPSPINYLIVVLFCRGRCHHHPSCSQLLPIVMHSSSLILRALFLCNSCHFCRCPSSIMLPIFLTFGKLISGFISLVSNS
jgi:hypothetical protein